MSHLRKIIFDLLTEGKSNDEILHTLRKTYKVFFTLARIVNYRQLYERLDPTTREDFIAGKLDLIGNKT